MPGPLVKKEGGELASPLLKKQGQLHCQVPSLERRGIKSPSSLRRGLGGGAYYFFANRSTWLAFSISSRAASVVERMPSMRSSNSSGFEQRTMASSSVISPWL